MGFLYERVVAPLLYRLDPETAHTAGLRAMGLLGALGPLRALLERGLAPPGTGPIALAGLRFPNAVGLAAGFDKDGLGWRGAAALGFGHVEVGTVTRLAQPGNPRPRVFRYPALRAVVNRYGFPNAGTEALARRLAAGPGPGNRPGPLGINIGKSKVVDAADRDAVAEDYLASFRLLAPHADYVAVNISSPNTPGLRALQDKAPLADLLGALQAENRGLPRGPVPIFLKIAPDLAYGQLDDILEVALGTGLAAIIATNTTVGRPAGTASCETSGGLSGAPLLARSLEVVRYLCRASDGRIPVIGCGGILNGAEAARFLDEGASLVQVYSGLVFRGPELAREVAQALAPRHPAVA
jgi:dihydroorotate dehydrogenase